MSHVKMTQPELLAAAKERFGDDPLDIAFQCPRCQDVATIRDFPKDKRHLAGQECIGRSLGALQGAAKDYKGRGCDWCSYGLLRGPWEIEMPDGHSAWSFPLAEQVTP